MFYVNDRGARNLKFVNLYCLSLTKAYQSEIIIMVVSIKLVELSTAIKDLILLLPRINLFLIIKYLTQKGAICLHFPFWLRARKASSNWKRVASTLAKLNHAIGSSRVM